MLCQLFQAYSKFKFCFLELSGIFFYNIFTLKLVDPVNEHPMDLEI